MSKKRKKTSAISIQYNQDGDRAPKVTAKGKGSVAEKIIAIAKEQNIPIKRDKDLMVLLEKIDIGQEIPDSLYKIIAELLAWVYHLNKEYPRTKKV
jgi:flagellar biosynthesis protein